MIKKLKHLKLFEDAHNDKIVAYHNSRTPIKNLTDQTMWFSLDLDGALGHYDNSIMDINKSYLYKAEIIANILDSDSIGEFFHKNNIDLDEWICDMVGNPTQEEIMNMEGTKKIIGSGYDGVIHTDYDQWDPSYDTDVLILFKPKSKIFRWEKIDNANKLLADYKKLNNI